MDYLSNYTLKELENWFKEKGYPKFRAKQIWQWVYHKNIVNYEEMLNIPQKLRQELCASLAIRSTSIKVVQTSKDGTKKYALSLDDGKIIEAVWIPMGKHDTACLSTQVGCPISCKFCASGAKGLDRNLSAAEMVEQLAHIFTQENFSESTNIVFMGIGEPLLNYDNLIKAIQIMHDAFNIGWRRITVSTTGVIAGIKKLAQDLPQVNLAISLHATNDHKRKELITHCPSSLEELLNALRDYHNATNRNITYEYVMLDKVNDSFSQAEDLADIIYKVPSKVNIIPYNEVPGGIYKSSSQTKIKAFAERLEDRGVIVLVRRRKGDDIAGACGQLRQQING